MQDNKINNVANLNFWQALELPYCSELKPLDGQQKSFYKKAYVYNNKKEHTLELRSYNTIVLKYNYNVGEFRRCWGGWSHTTAQHIKAFCGRYITKDEWLDLGNGLPIFLADELHDPRGLIVARRSLA